MASLDEQIAAARAAWPTFAVPAERFAEAIAARPGELHLADLYLACGCASGDPAALAAFEQHCGPAIERALIASGATPVERADLGQVIRQRLLVEPAAGGPPRIASY